jgi:ferredoxin-NADP reductase
LVIERLDNGEVSPFFHDVIAVGDEIELRGHLADILSGPMKMAARCC